jgi:hypothetical protein
VDGLRELRGVPRAGLRGDGGRPAGGLSLEACAETWPKRRGAWRSLSPPIPIPGRPTPRAVRDAAGVSACHAPRTTPRAAPGPAPRRRGGPRRCAAARAPSAECPARRGIHHSTATLAVPPAGHGGAHRHAGLPEAPGRYQGPRRYLRLAARHSGPASARHRVPTEEERLERLFGYILHYTFGRSNEGPAMKTPVEALLEKVPDISPMWLRFLPSSSIGSTSRRPSSSLQLVAEVGRLDPTLTSRCPRIRWLPWPPRASAEPRGVPAGTRDTVDVPGRMGRPELPAGRTRIG